MGLISPSGALMLETPLAAGFRGAARQLAADNRRALEAAVDAAGRRFEIISIDDAYEVATPHRMFCRVAGSTASPNSNPLE
jgi:hypothetical protein